MLQMPYLMRLKHFITLLSLLALALLFLFTSGSQYSCAASNSAIPLKVGFVLVGSITDWGWNYAHNQGRLFLEKTMPGQAVTTLVERVPESAEAERVMEKMIAQGNKLIFTTSYGFLEPVLRVATRHPDVTFMQTHRISNAQNIGTLTCYMYEPLYICGMVAGRMTKTNKMGFVAGHPVPPVLQQINAFTLGARLVNPKAKVHVVWVNSWEDPPTEAEAAKGLIDTGADVIAGVLNTSKTIVQTAESRRVFSIGTDVDLHQFAPKGWLTGGMWNWGPLYVRTATAVRDGKWKAANETYSMKDNSVKLASFGRTVAKAVQQEALALEQSIRQGKFTVFQGPLKDREGRARLKPEEKPDTTWLANMDFFVAGVEGSLPKK